MYTVGRLAKKYGLSRSTLLYYDSIGLLSPTLHNKGEYRQYSEDDAQNLGQICAYRQAGLSLKDITLLLSSESSSELESVLKQRLNELSEEAAVLHNQRRVVAELLNKSTLADAREMNKNTWQTLFQEAGISEQEMRHWHADFERMNPDKHARFLRFLHIPEEEIGLIRAWSAAPHKILNLKKESEKFMESFFRIYEKLDRKGPGDYESTKRAFELCTSLPKNPEIIDIGCGNGRNAVDLAKLSGARVTALDIYEPYLHETQNTALQAGLEERIITMKADMADLCFKAQSLDLIWSEGAAYIMGFDAALNYWKQFLKPGACMALSEAMWLRSDAPEELRIFWNEAYPAMRDSRANIKAVEEAGYKLLGHFVIPQRDWDIFYDNLEQHLQSIEAEHINDSCGAVILEMSRKEIEIYRKYKGCYGYEFYVMQKPLK
ncbi:MerR family transcriptional regulator [Psychromonas aquimarina]|uniref:MerR family transcriptional regulator n=1 Tax=Psychromonas aquimarina TaxID=444919 RepID=UPI0004149618|nr:MerR family transcriptional regulator [Psychromonas aquimarina]